MKEVSLITHRRTEFLDITSLIQDTLTRSDAREGICFICCPHTTAGLMINERADPAVVHDIGSFLGECVLEDHPLTHAEGNSPAHVKAALIGGSVQVAFEEGKLLSGRWQGIFLAEFDGPRKRRIWLAIAS